MSAAELRVLAERTLDHDYGGSSSVLAQAVLDLLDGRCLDCGHPAPHEGACLVAVNDVPPIFCGCEAS